MIVMILASLGKSFGAAACPIVAFAVDLPPDSDKKALDYGIGSTRGQVAGSSDLLPSCWIHEGLEYFRFMKNPHDGAVQMPVEPLAGPRNRRH